MSILVEQLILNYLMVKLDRGQHQYVFHLSNRWAPRVWVFSLAFEGALWSIQARLINEFGYHECPSCGWATECSHQHMHEGSWCLENLLLF